MLMIRLFLHVCKCFHKIKNLSETDGYQILSRQIYDNLKRCPHCGAPSSKFHKDGEYLRNFVSYEHNKVVSCTITVKCVECSSCGHSHALLPSMIIPYSSFSVKFILALLSHYVRGNFTSVASLCEHFQISIATFYRIYKCFLQDGLYLDKVLKISAGSLFSSEEKEPWGHAILEKFFQCLGYSFLQPCVRIRPGLYVKNLPSHISRYLENVQALVNEVC